MLVLLMEMTVLIAMLQFLIEHGVAIVQDLVYLDKEIVDLMIIIVQMDSCVDLIIVKMNTQGNRLIVALSKTQV